MLNKKKISPKNIKGQSLLEVVIAIALIAIVLTTIVSVSTLSIRSSVFARNQTEASRFNEQASEWLVAEKDADWTTFSNHANTATWCLDNLLWTNSGNCSSAEIISGTIFTRSLSFVKNPDGSIQGTMNTKWTDSQGTHTISSSTIFANWK